MIVNIIMFFTMYPVLLVLYFCFRGQYQYADGCLFAVNMKPEWIKEPEVAAIVEKFRREMKQYFIFLLIVPLSSFLTKHMSIQLTIWMMWILIAIVLLCLPLVHANSGLKRWKTEHCLYETEKTEHRIELKAVGKVRRVNFLPFFLPNLVALLLALVPVWAKSFNPALEKTIELSSVGWLTIVMWLCGVALTAVAVWMDRQPTAVINNDSDVNLNYTRARKNIWKNFWLIVLWLNTAFAAVILAGSLGAGGITYGVVRNIDKLPFVHQQEPQEKETAETQKEEQAEPEETPKATQAAEADDKAEEKSSEKEEKKLSEEELYRTFYDGYVEDENLQVIQDGYVADYDFNTGYANDLLLSATMEDFGGGGNKELLLIRTRAKEKDENSSNYTDVERPLYMELYGIDDQKVVLRKELEIPNTDLNTYEDSIEEKLELRKKEGSYYLYRSGRWSPAHGASDYLDTFIKMSETDMVQECNLRWCFGATYGTCQINGRDFYTGNKDSDMQQIENQLEVYGMNGGQELTGPYLLDFNRGADLDAQTYSQRDNVILQNCFATQPAVVSPTFTPIPTIEIP